MASVKAIEARGFSFRYPESTAGIGPLDWAVEEGAFQLLVGATGSGKTTLLGSCKPAIAPAGERAGSLQVFGRSVEKLDAREAAATVGYVAQSPENQIVCDSVWHELAFGLENLGVEQDEMRRRVAEVAHFFGIEPWFRRSVAELSGGQKQMTRGREELPARSVSREPRAGHHRRRGHPRPRGDGRVRDGHGGAARGHADPLLRTARRGVGLPSFRIRPGGTRLRSG